MSRSQVRAVWRLFIANRVAQKGYSGFYDFLETLDAVAPKLLARIVR